MQLTRKTMVFATLVACGLFWGVPGEAGEVDQTTQDAARERIYADVFPGLPKLPERYRFSRVRPPLERDIRFPVMELRKDEADGQFLAFTVIEVDYRARAKKKVEATSQNASAHEDSGEKTLATGCYYPKSDAIYVLDAKKGRFVTPAKSSSLKFDEGDAPKAQGKAPSSPCAKKAKTTDNPLVL